MFSAGDIPEVLEVSGRIAPLFGWFIGGAALVIIVTFLVRRLVRLLTELFLKDDDHDPHH